MKMLTITRPAIPTDDDFCWGVEGELAIPMFTNCQTPECGCDRALVGLNSHRGSTTVKVTAIDLTPEDVLAAVIGFFDDTGIRTNWFADLTPAEVRQVALDTVMQSARVAEGHPVGVMLRPQFHPEHESWSFSRVP